MIVLRQKYFIDFSKGITPLVIFGLMYFYNRVDNYAAWIYLALHGSYGTLWVVKSQVFPDKQWEAKCSIGYGLYITGGLAFYWVAPWLLCRNDVQIVPWEDLLESPAPYRQ